MGRGPDKRQEGPASQPVRTLNPTSTQHQPNTNPSQPKSQGSSSTGSGEGSPPKVPQLAGDKDQQVYSWAVVRAGQGWGTENAVFQKGAEEPRPDPRTARLSLEQVPLRRTPVRRKAKERPRKGRPGAGGTRTLNRLIKIPR